MAKRSRSPDEVMSDSHDTLNNSFVHRWWNHLVAFADLVAHPQRKRRAVDIDPARLTEGHLLDAPNDQRVSNEQETNADSDASISEAARPFDGLGGNAKPSDNGVPTSNLNTHACTNEAGSQKDTVPDSDPSDDPHHEQNAEVMSAPIKNQTQTELSTQAGDQAANESNVLIDKPMSHKQLLHDPSKQGKQYTPLIDAAYLEAHSGSSTIQPQSLEEAHSQSSEEPCLDSPTLESQLPKNDHLDPPTNQSQPWEEDSFETQPIQTPSSLKLSSQALSDSSDESDQLSEDHDHYQLESESGSDDSEAQHSKCSQDSKYNRRSSSSGMEWSERPSDDQGQEGEVENKGESRAGSEAESEAENEAESEAEIEAESEAESETENGAESQEESQAESEAENDYESGIENEHESDGELSWDQQDSDTDIYAHETHQYDSDASKPSIDPSVQSRSGLKDRMSTEVVVIDDSDDDSDSATDQLSVTTQNSESEPISSRYAVTSASALPRNSNFAFSGPRESSFSPKFNNASDLSTKRLFRVSTSTKRISNHVANAANSPRLVSSLGQRRKAPLGHEEFKAQIQNRQQARIASMVYETYRALSHQNRSPPAFADFQSLVKKRSHVQRLLDLENAKASVLSDSKVLDEQAYTQRTLDDLRAREVKARLRLPAKIAPDEQQRADICAARAERRAKHGILGRQPLPKSLPTHIQQQVNRVFQQRGVIASMTGAQVEAHDLAKLGPGQWLNDEVINFYGTLIQQRANEAERLREEARQQKQPPPHEACAFWSVHFFSSYFWQKLQSNGYKGVQRWSRRVDLFTKDLILLPINLGQSHWVCAAINLRLRRFEYYDSIGIARPKVFESLRDYLAQELQAKKQLSIDWTDWQDYFAGESSPQQANGFDCGVFAIQTLEQVSRRDAFLPMPQPLTAASFCKPADGKELAYERMMHAEEYAWNFSQEHMPYLRRRMVHEIASKHLLPS
ncbi:Ulp1 peptidase [Malassezia yamatoensis]|uniref:Ulp1 peptidase n=1 Tax=Malassezia yamatoensis TaxID=253288 RepID=A0AAJ5YWQ6_9BASI|nr:Ulp1 peptidase [Malassezia yamatoensis]